jgi:hypothetical protein
MRFKKKVWFIGALLLLQQNSITSCEKTWQQKCTTFLFHPLTLLTTGLTAFGTYAFANQSTSLETCNWIKNKWNETPALVKYPLIFLGGWFVYYNNYRFRQLHDQNNKLTEQLNEKVLENRIKKSYPQPLDNKELKRNINEIYIRLTNVEKILGIEGIFEKEKERTESVVEKLKTDITNLDKKIEQIETVLKMN